MQQTHSLTHTTLLTCIHTHTSTQAGTHSHTPLFSHAYILTQAHRHTLSSHTLFSHAYILTQAHRQAHTHDTPLLIGAWNVYQKIQAEDLGHSSGHHSSANNVISKISYMNRSTNTHCSWSWCKLHRYTALQVAMLLTESHGNIIPSALLPLSL